MSSLYFQICSGAYLILLVIVYFSKKKVMNIENKIYSALIITSAAGLILDYASTYLAIIDVHNVYLNFICKLYLVYLLVWIFLFTIYTFVISFKNSQNNGKIRAMFRKEILPLIIFIFIVCLSLVFILPLYNFSENGVVYTYGPSAQLLYAISGIAFVIMIICIIIKFKNVATNKYLPIIAYIVLSILAALIQFSYPEILLVTSISIFVIFFMFFTIENPDLKMINELNIARNQADKANHAKSEFLSHMSHEIRTPLNAILGFSQSLDEMDMPSDAKEDIKDIKMASNNLLELVNGILDISKIEAGKLEIINTEYNIHKLLNEIVALAKGRLGEKPLEFKTNFDKSLPQVLYGDHSRLKQIIINLLTNAIKYTNEGYIDFQVSTVTTGDVCRLIISVEDSGVGIPTEKIDKLFTKFERVGVEKYNSAEGTGLGLAITKKLVELMNGQIVVQSMYAVGSKFTVAIDQKLVVNPTVEQSSNTEVLYLNPLKFNNQKILIVDDNKLNLKVAARLLSNYNVQIEEVISGQECLDKIISGNKYDLILLDDMMPKMSGVETLQKLKKIDGFDTPVVALTANAIIGMREKYLNDGFDDYIPKPIERNTLNNVLRNFLK